MVVLSFALSDTTENRLDAADGLTNPYWKRIRPAHPTVPGVDLELHAAIATLSTGDYHPSFLVN